MNRSISERKYIANHLSSLFKYYEGTFETLSFDYIETHSRAAKITKTSTNLGIVLVDVKAIRNSDSHDVWHMEVAGPPSSGDSIKTIRTDVLNLVELLRNHLD